MSRITTEAEWVSCDEPWALAQVAWGRADSRRFRWLAAAWGNRIRHLFEPDDRPWFDAFAAWVAGAGPHPSEVCRWEISYPLDCGSMAALARRCAEAIRTGDLLTAAVCAGVAAGEDCPFPALPPPDSAHAHRGRSAAKRAAEKARVDAHREAWQAARAAHEGRTHREFCDEFRDVAGNPFRPTRRRPEWQASAVASLARGIDAERAFDRLPILADALEEAGCEDGQLLGHCRGDGPHVQGCWAIELLIGGG